MIPFVRYVLRKA